MLSGSSEYPFSSLLESAECPVSSDLRVFDSLLLKGKPPVKKTNVAMAPKMPPNPKKPKNNKMPPVVDKISAASSRTGLVLLSVPVQSKSRVAIGSTMSMNKRRSHKSASGGHPSIKEVNTLPLYTRRNASGVWYTLRSVGPLIIS
jgi:hypothetical protein